MFPDTWAAELDKGVTPALMARMAELWEERAKARRGGAAASLEEAPSPEPEGSPITPETLSRLVGAPWDPTAIKALVEAARLFRWPDAAEWELAPLAEMLSSSALLPNMLKQAQDDLKKSRAGTVRAETQYLTLRDRLQAILNDPGLMNPDDCLQRVEDLCRYAAIATGRDAKPHTSAEILEGLKSIQRAALQSHELRAALRLPEGMTWAAMVGKLMDLMEAIEVTVREADDEPLKFPALIAGLRDLHDEHGELKAELKVLKTASAAVPKLRSEVEEISRDAELRIVETTRLERENTGLRAEVEHLRTALEQSRAQAPALAKEKRREGTSGARWYKLWYNGGASYATSAVEVHARRELNGFCTKRGDFYPMHIILRAEALELPSPEPEMEVVYQDRHEMVERVESDTVLFYGGKWIGRSAWTPQNVKLAKETDSD